MYTYDQVYNATLNYFGGNELAANVWVNKYALKDQQGVFYELTPDDMHRRLAKELYRAESKYKTGGEGLSEYGQNRKPLSEQDIYELLRDFKKAIPQGSIMMSLGNPYILASLSNCVVIPGPIDSYGGIMYTDQQLTQLFKRRCGVGFGISDLRPKGLTVNNAALSTTGAVSFMERFSNTTREVALNGRRGALMLIMDCRHPDIEEFIKVKLDNKKVTGANITVTWCDEFMLAVKNNAEYTLRWPVEADPKDAQITKVVNARDVWMSAVKSAHQSAEPGVAFIDRIRDYSTCNNYSYISYSNPCAEIFMGNSDSCRLLAINMFHAVKNPYTESAAFDFGEWYKTVYESQRLMDDIVDLELEAVSKIIAKIKADPEPDYIKAVELQTWEALYKSGVEGRRTGCGLTGLADVISALNSKYDEATDLIDLIMRVKLEAEFNSSIDTAIERGAFPLFDPAKESGAFIDMLREEFPEIHTRMMKYGRRSVSLSTIAPGGSLSLLAKLVNRYGTSSGIEPVFANWYTRRKKVNPNDPDVKVDFTDELGDKWQEFKVYHSGLLEWADINQTDPESELSPYYKSTSADIDWINRVKIQATCQKYITHSISSTINLPENVSVDKVAEIYEKAWEMGLKGITVYRENSRSGVLITETKSTYQKRPKTLKSDVHKIKINGDKWLLLIGMLDDKPYELFAVKHSGEDIVGKTGTITKVKPKVYDLTVGDFTLKDITKLNSDDEQALTRAISLMFRSSIPLKFIVEQLTKSEGSVVSFAKAVNRVLAKYTTEEVVLRCSECGDIALIMQEGCSMCVNCGGSKCN
jgi:ribonucleoside-diphosphate reductase alpha chain